LGINHIPLKTQQAVYPKTSISVLIPKVTSLIGMLLIISNVFGQAPANDLCANATPITSSAVYTPTSGTVANATVDAVPTCSGSVKYDVWYTFVAQSINPIISLTNPGANFNSPRIQVFSGSCGSLTSLFCNTAALAATNTFNFTIGVTYTIRVFSVTGGVPSSAAGFDIAVTDRPLNDYCANAVTLTSGNSCATVTGNVANATNSGSVPASCLGTAQYDVWYRFTAQSRNPAITLSAIGAGFVSPKIQVLTGVCGTFTVVACNTAPIIETQPLNLTVGTTYYVRVYSTTGPVPALDGNFDICIVDPVAPVNDEPAGAINLASDATCINTVGNVGNATYNVSAGATACTGTDRYDVWYTFTAQRRNPTIAVTGANATYFNTPKVQLFSGVPGSLVSLGCANAPYTAAGLNPGQVYYVRVYTTNATPLPNTTFGSFNICITDPAIPINDDCVNATDLTPNNNATCAATTTGSLLNAGSSAGIPGDCGIAGSADVWYKFVATRPYQEVRIATSTAGAQFASSGLRLQILSGTCGSFTSIVCNQTTGTSLVAVPTGSGFTVGDTYYVRVYSNQPVSAQTLNTWTFTVCITTPDVPTYHYGTAYANITKGSGGGTIEPGDELEIRAVFNLRSNAVYNASFTDIIPANTTYVPGTLRILTNEGKIFRQYTDAADGDPGTITGSNVKINFGKDASENSGGLMRSSDKPGSVIMISYRIRVNAVPYGTLLQLGGGNINFNVSDAVGTPTVIDYSATPAIVYQNYGICTNTIGSNGILSEFGGTFGSGTTKNRGSSNKVPANYTYANFTTGAPGDYFYGVSNNTSSDSLANYSINPNDPIGSLTRVYKIWDIIGDHTGAADPLAGNLPADVNNNVSGGYMVVINAAYRADTAFQDTVRNLCPNTSYEYSAWFRNICRKCGVDSNGVQALNAGYIPTGPGDSSGVHPNLTFNINGHDYYTTGDIAYTGQWVKKGFTYRTGPNETEMVIFIRNNAPGGGGNDWAIDDIGVATCSPTLITNPDSSSVGVCYGDGRSLSAQVISYYDNFTYWIWEKSIDNGTTWLNTGYSGNTVPTFVGGNYEYTATGPSVPRRFGNAS